MSRKLMMAQPPFTMLVGNTAGGSNPSRGPSGNPVNVRRSFTFQHFPEMMGRGPRTTPQSEDTPGVGTRWGHVEYTTPPEPVRATGTITVASNAFAGPTAVRIGQFELTSGEDFLIGALASDTANNLASAIGDLPGYSASALGAVVTVDGLPGVIGNEVLFSSTGSSPNNFTFSPVNRRMAGAEPKIGPPVIA